MARIRTFKPEFWEDDVVGTVSRDARLLFLAVLSMADDEGLLRWTAVYVKSKAFMYDDDLGVAEVQHLMDEVVAAGFVFPYVGGRAQQRLAFVVNFRRHQKINRPQPSKLPPPSVQNPAVREMYGRRDSWLCGICGREISQEWNVGVDGRVSLDHIQPASAGGSDYPSNVRAAHLICNKRRGAKPLDPDELTALGLETPTEPFTGPGMTESSPQVVSHSLNSSVLSSPPEGKGNGGDMEGEARDAPPVRSASPSRSDPEPPRKCRKHTNTAEPPPCRACGDARREHDAWKDRRSVANVPAQPMCPVHPDQPTGSKACPRCTVEVALPPADFRSRVGA